MAGVSYYGITFPEWWTGKTGREIRRRGGKDGQILGLYLQSNRHANMIGLYRLLEDDVENETGLKAREIARAFAVIDSAGFARYDVGSSYVWVLSMARIRLGLKVGAVLDPDDNRVTACNRLYQAVDANPFLGDFYDRNRKLLHLKKRREGSGLVVDPSPVHHGSPLPRGLEGAYKPVTDPGTGDQDQVQERARRLSPSPAPSGVEPNPRVIRELVGHVLAQADPSEDFAGLKELAKRACAKHRLVYDADVVGSALEQALARQQRKRATH